MPQTANFLEEYNMDTKDYCDDLKRNGLKQTRLRIEILQILNQSVQPLTADNIFLELTENDIPACLSTVYRTLDALGNKDIVTKLEISSEDKALYEYNRKVHRHYLVCLGCKSIKPIDYCPIQDYQELLEKETNYLISGHKLNIYGYCPACRRKKKRTDS